MEIYNSQESDPDEEAAKAEEPNPDDLAAEGMLVCTETIEEALGGFMDVYDLVEARDDAVEEDQYNPDNNFDSQLLEVEPDNDQLQSIEVKLDEFGNLIASCPEIELVNANEIDHENHENHETTEKEGN